MFENTSNKKSNSETEMVDSPKGKYQDLFKTVFDDSDSGICIVEQWPEPEV